MIPQQRPSRAGRLLRRVLFVAVPIGLATLVVWGALESRGEAAREALREKPVAAPLRIAELDGQPAVRLAAAAMQANGIAVAAPTQAPYQNQHRAYGTVLDLAPLTDLGNTYARARAQQQMAQAKLAASKTAFERARGLYKNQQNVSLAQFQTTQATFQADQAAVTAADSQVRALAATALQTWGPVIGRALLDEAPLVTRLIERQDFLLQITLPPGVSVSTPPQTATVQAADGQRTPVTYVSPATKTDPRIQGMSFFYLAPASSGVLPGMSVLASLPSGTPSQGAAIPPSAIVWWQDRAWVYRQAGADLFVRTQIPTDLPAKDGGYIVKDLPKDAKLVTHGTQLLLSEEFRAQIQVGAD